MFKECCKKTVSNIPHILDMRFKGEHVSSTYLPSVLSFIYFLRHVPHRIKYIHHCENIKYGMLCKIRLENTLS